MLPRSRSGETERLIRRFADACSRRDALLDSCRRAMADLIDAGQLLEGLESADTYSIDATGAHHADAVARMPAYPSHADLWACLRDLAAVSAEIRALRPALRASAIGPAAAARSIRPR